MNSALRTYFELKKGHKYSKSELNSTLFKIRLNQGNSMRFFAMLQRDGVVEVRGKTVYVKKDFRL